MSTYTLTPAERKARAQALKQTRENRFMYEKYMNEKAKLEEKQAAEEQARLDEESRRNSQNFLVRGLSTVGDICANVITGAVKGLEGIVDLGIGLVGAVGGIFDGDFQSRVKDVIAYDWTGETFGNALQEALKYSYTTNGGIVENVASGIGQMLPAVLVSVATAGAGAPAAVAQAASLATMGVSAAGTSTESAFQEGADYWAGLGYGVASGLVEVGTEKMFGGATKALTGAGILDGVTRSVADTGIKRIVKNALEEGVEEIVSELANPALKSIYKGSEALSEYKTGEYWKGVGEAGLVGSLTALAYSGTVGYGLSKVGVGYVGKEADIADSLSEISTLKEKANNYQANGELVGINEKKIADTTMKNYQNIEKVLQSVSEEKRSKLIKKFSLGQAFNENGTMSEQMSAWFKSVGEQTAEGDNGAQSELASLKKDSYSFNLRGQEQSIVTDLSDISEDLAQKYVEAQKKKGKTVTIEQARERIGSIKVFNGEMSETATEGRNKFNKALNYLNRESGANISFVITEDNDSFNGVTHNGKIYIGQDQFEKGTWAKPLVHEFTHLAEGTEEYARFVDFISSDNFLIEDGNGGQVELWKAGQETVFKKGYGFDRARIEEIHEKIANEQSITADEQKYFNDFVTEVAAHESGFLLGNESFIDKMVAEDSSFAQKFVKKIESLKKAFARIGDSQAKATYKQLQTAEKLWLKAAYKAGDIRLAKMILSYNPDLEKEFDLSGEIRYNRKGRQYINISQQEYATISARIMENNSGVIAKGGEVERYSVVRSANYFYVYENFSEGEFGVLKQIALTDDNIDYINAVEEKIGESNGETIIRSTSELNRVLEVLKSKSRKHSGDNAYDSARRTNSGNGGISLEQSESDGIGNPQKSGGNQRIKYSLKDSDGNSLTVEQQEYFKGSKVVDTDGNLLVVYHGSPSKFTEFSHRFMNTNGNAHGRGFYFTEDIDYADNYRKDGGQLLKGYLDIKKPASETKITMSKAKLAKLIQATCEMQAQEFVAEESYDNIDSALLDTWVSNYVNTYDAYSMDSVYKQVAESVFNSCDNDVDIFAELTNGGAGTERVLSLARKVLGYDGIIYDNGNGTHQFVSFESNQFKNLDNVKPTKSQDIRFSLKGENGTLEDIENKYKSYTKYLSINEGENQITLRNIVLKESERNKGIGQAFIEDLIEYADRKGKTITLTPTREYGTYEQLKKWYKRNGFVENKGRNADLRLSDTMYRLPESDIRFSLKIGGENVGTDGKYSFDTDSEIMLKDIASQNDITKYLPEGLSKEFIRAIKNHGNFTFSRLYRGMEAEEFDSVKKNGYIKSKGEYNFSNQKGETFFSHDVREAFSYATGFAPAGIREKFFEQGKPAYIVEVGNYGDLNFKYNTVKESSTTKEIDVKYITRILELRFNEADNKVYVKDISIDGMNSANGEFIHGEPVFVQDKKTGQILYAVQDESGYETGEYISAREPGLVIDYSKLENAAPYEVEYRTKAANISGNEADLIPYNFESNDIRFDLKENDPSKKYFYELTDGQIKKLLADNTKRKVYSKVESEQIINTIISESLGVGEKYGRLVGKAKAEVIEMLWRGLNTAEPGKQMKVALDVAEYIIQNSALETLMDEAETEIWVDTINALKPYLHSLDLSALKGEIRYRYDKDNSAYLLWGKRKGERGLTADQVQMELAEEGYLIDSENEADIFFRMDSAYREAVDGLKRKTKEMLSSALTAEERKTLKNNIAREVLLAFDKNGKPSKLSKILDQYRKQANVWKEKYYDERQRNTVINRLLDSVQKIKDIKYGTFLNASQFKSDIFKKSIERLSNIKYRGDLNKAGTREIISGLQEWYVESNPLLEGVYDSDIAEMLSDIATGDGKLTTQELRNLTNVVGYFKHFIESFNKVYRNGKYVEAQPIAQKYVAIMKENQSVNVGWHKRFFDKYLTTFGDPMTVARYMDKYSDGFYSEMLATLREGATNAQIDEMNIREPIEDFIKRNRKYFKEARKKTVVYEGKEIPLLQAMYIYMAMNDVDTIPSFAKSGYVFNDGNKDVRVDGFFQNEDVEIDVMKERAKEIQASLEKQFTAADKEYIEIVKKIFNEDCRKRFSETSIILKGYSNAKEGDYVPIRRANIAKNVDTSTFEYEVNRASNASFTKDRVKGAIGELRVDSLDEVVDRHISAIVQYANLAPAIEEYNKLFNLNTGENHNKPTSVATESRNLWAQGDEYFKKLISDIQGVPTAKGVGTKAMAFIRGGYAKYQLGANPKVWVTQLSSFFASGSILDYTSIIKGIGIKAGDVDKYCELAKLRNNDNTAAMAQGVLDKIDTVGNVLMKPIGVMDRFVIKKLFGACQVQVQKENGLKIGTEENKVKAGELLKKVILETQQNSMATERSAAMRSGSEFMRTITMFSADSMKVVGRVIDSIGELSTLKAKRKVLTDTVEIQKVDEQIKKATKKVAKSTTSLITSSIFMALVAQLFRTLYNKDDEDDNIVENMTVDAIGNLFGGLPVFKDIYSFFAEGYEVDGYAYSAINDLLNSAKNIFDMCGNLVSGEATSQEVAKNIKNMLYAAGQIFGIPVRNVYNLTYGLTKRISPSTAYKVDTMFYNKNYSSDLKKAIANGDDDMIATIVELMTSERIGGINDSTVSKELNSLVTKGYDVIPRSVGSKITYDGEEITLTSGQREQFNKVYSVANKAVASLVKLSQYESATDEVKAKAIKYIYNVYYNLALQDLLGEDLETKTVLFAEAIDVEKLAIIVATANSLTADLDKKGKAISGTRKRKIQAYVNSLRLTAAQKYMVMGYLGFTNVKGETQVKAYINRLKLTKSEKAKLLKYSGYGQ